MYGIIRVILVILGVTDVQLPPMHHVWIVDWGSISWLTFRGNIVCLRVRCCTTSSLGLIVWIAIVPVRLVMGLILIHVLLVWMGCICRRGCVGMFALRGPTLIK